MEKNKYLWLFFACIFCLGGAQYVDAAEVYSQLTPAEEIKIFEQRLAQMPSQAVENELWALGSVPSYQVNQDFRYRIHTNAYYHPLTVTASGDRIRLHDGSLWAVPPSKGWLVKKWVSNDRLFIKPNAACFSFHKYVMHNLDSPTLDVIPVKFVEEHAGAATFWIIGIDYFQKLVYLSDHTVWQINPYDYAFDKWRPEQRVIVGVNNHWREASYPHILINVSMPGAPYCEADISQ